jgi:hypothetical protein
MRHSRRADIATVRRQTHSGVSRVGSKSQHVVSAASRDIEQPHWLLAKQARICKASPYRAGGATKHVHSPQARQRPAMNSIIQAGLIHELRLPISFIQ